ncbi:MAG: transketolase C-terminal domain-containing protein, partial [Candidatus Zixiibacteriota bacterium]
QRIVDGWRSDGWNVVEVDGHSLDELYGELRNARQTAGASAPTVIIAHTVMGKGYPPIENDHNYHGAALKPDAARDAFRALGFTDPAYDDLDELLAKRAQGPPSGVPHPEPIVLSVNSGEARTYSPEELVDNRSAWGNALVALADTNGVGRPGGLPMVVYDCDLSKSVKTDGFEGKYAKWFMQSGISEHSTASCAGATSAEGVLTFWSDFGVFGVSETYNQNRLNDINEANLKVVCTHCGLDVGEDGKTHQCIDYFALSRSVFGWKLFTPADPNQTDRIVRYIAGEYGNFLVVMGRSKMNPLASLDGSALFGGSYQFQPGRTDMIRDGRSVTIFCAGNVVHQGLAAWEILRAEGIEARLVSSAHWADFHADDLKSIAEFGRIITVEDHNVNTGIGVSLSAELFACGLPARITKLGVTTYGSSGKSKDIYRMMRIDGVSIAEEAHDMLSSATEIKSKTSVTSVEI